jgi:hypothetical protein
MWEQQHRYLGPLTALFLLYIAAAHNMCMHRGSSATRHSLHAEGVLIQCAAWGSRRAGLPLLWRRCGLTSCLPLCSPRHHELPLHRQVLPQLSLNGGLAHSSQPNSARRRASIQLRVHGVSATGQRPSAMHCGL